MLRLACVIALALVARLDGWSATNGCGDRAALEVRVAGPAGSSDGLSVHISAEAPFVDGKPAKPFDDGVRYGASAVVVNGAAKFKGLHAGVAFSAYISDSLGSLSETMVDLAASAPGEQRQATLPTPRVDSLLTGLVSDASGAPVAGADVRLRVGQGGNWSGHPFTLMGGGGATYTKGDGRFQFAGIRRVSVGILVSSPNGAVEQVLKLAPGPNEATFRLEPRRTLVCVVSDANRRPIAEAQWELSAVDGAMFACEAITEFGSPFRSGVFKTAKRDVRAEVVVAGRKLAGKAGPEDERLEIAATGVGYVRATPPKSRKERAAMFNRVITATPTGDDARMPVQFMADGSFTSKDAIGTPLWAGPWRLTRDDRPAQPRDILVEAGATTVVEFD